MMKLHAERLIWRQADFPLCVDWNGSIIWQWSPLESPDLDCNNVVISPLHLPLPRQLFQHTLGFIRTGFMDALCTSFWIRPFSHTDHPESIIRGSCKTHTREPICQPWSVFGYRCKDFDMPCAGDPKGGRLWLQRRIGWLTGQALRTATRTSSLWYGINKSCSASYDRQVIRPWEAHLYVCLLYKGEPIGDVVIGQSFTHMQTFTFYH